MIRLLILLPLLLLVVPGPAAATTATDRAGAYLESRLDRNGCAAEPGGRSSVNLTAWAALGLVAAGRSARRPATCIAGRIREVRTVADLEMAILALRAGGVGVRDVGGRDLIAELEGSIRGGRIGPTIGTTHFGILALRASGRPVPRAVRTRLLRDQNPDGTWPVSPGGDGDSNLTASGLQAAVAAGVPRADRRLLRAATALRGFRSSGGYALAEGGRPDAQSTAWVLQGLAAIGRRDPAAERFLAGLQQRDGSVTYQRGTRITPVWVTAQAAGGLARRPFPFPLR